MNEERNKELENIKDDDSFKCKDCQKWWHGWAIKDNFGCCPDCKRLLI